MKKNILISLFSLVFLFVLSPLNVFASSSVNQTIRYWDSKSAVLANTTDDNYGAKPIIDFYYFNGATGKRPITDNQGVALTTGKFTNMMNYVVNYAQANTNTTNHKYYLISFYFSEYSFSSSLGPDTAWFMITWFTESDLPNIKFSYRTLNTTDGTPFASDIIVGQTSGVYFASQTYKWSDFNSATPAVSSTHIVGEQPYNGPVIASYNGNIDKYNSITDNHSAWFPNTILKYTNIPVATMNNIVTTYNYRGSNYTGSLFDTATNSTYAFNSTFTFLYEAPTYTTLNIPINAEFMSFYLKDYQNGNANDTYSFTFNGEYKYKYGNLTGNGVLNDTSFTNTSHLISNVKLDSVHYSGSIPYYTLSLETALAHESISFNTIIPGNSIDIMIIDKVEANFRSQYYIMYRADLFNYIFYDKTGAIIPYTDSNSNVIDNIHYIDDFGQDYVSNYVPVNGSNICNSAFGCITYHVSNFFGSIAYLVSMFVLFFSSMPLIYQSFIIVCFGFGVVGLIIKLIL